MTQVFRSGSVRVRVPATSANLGPGFDALGLAVSLYDEVVVRVVPSGLRIEVTGEGAAPGDQTPGGEENLLVRALRAGFAVLGGQPTGLQISCRNQIPHARGLGSSAAAIVAGMVAARALVTKGESLLDDAALLDLASRMEGHPDNVAATLLGGLTIAWSVGSRARAVRVVPHSRIQPVVFIPAVKSSTSQARGLIPASVPHADAAFNAGRAALLVHALTSDPSLLFTATEDRLHQRYRAEAMPESAELLSKLRESGTPAVISGAGGTVLAFAVDGEAEVGRPDTEVSPAFTSYALKVDSGGATAAIVEN
jgi:homoserine kinase